MNKDKLVVQAIGFFVVGLILYNTWQFFVAAFAAYGAWYLFMQNNRPKPPRCR